MDENQQPTIHSKSGRPFATSAVALQGIIVRDDERILLMNQPSRDHGWQVVSGALEAEETVLGGVLRETAEEAGPELRVRPLGTVHAETFQYDSSVQYMIGIYYLLHYDGGEVVPGDDMAGSAVRWWSIEELGSAGVELHNSTKLWMLERAVVLDRLWRNATAKPLQRPLEEEDR